MAARRRPWYPLRPLGRSAKDAKGLGRRIALVYTTEVHVVVDLDSGGIDTVAVDDEGLVPPRLPKGAPARARRALQIAQGGDAEWPGWEFGL